ncbi:MAG: hypothetical protein ACLQNE_11285 [Thermoguttaceae bacterium]
MANPYESPKSSEMISPNRQTGLARGVTWAIPLAVCGFCVPFVVLGAVLLIRIAFTEMLAFDRRAEIDSIFRNAIDSAVVCMLMFAFSGLANFTPRCGIGLVRSLMVMGLVALVALVVTVFATVALDLGPRTDPYAPLRAAIFFVLMGAGGTAFTRWQIKRSEIHP